ncbi:MAG: MarR family transcriptional regulator [Deltaproteobacteria bacterium]|nr:MarR family transcriptional regulator [Deltaproteobacteria bacterium]
MNINSKKTELTYNAINSLNRLFEIVQKRRAAIAAEVGLTDMQWQVLEEISTEHFMPSLFATKRKSSRAAVSKILKQLTDKGLLDVALNSQDARVREFFLTSDGENIMKKIRASREDAILEIWMNYSEQQLMDFCEFNEDLIGSMESYLSKEK